MQIHILNLCQDSKQSYKQLMKFRIYSSNNFQIKNAKWHLYEIIGAFRRFVVVIYWLFLIDTLHIPELRRILFPVLKGFQTSYPS